MKKLFTLLFAIVATMNLWAIGRNDGSNMANAIDFDWINGVQQSSGTKWYHLDLAPLYDSTDTLRFHITNLSNTESVDVSCRIMIMGETDSFEQTLAPQSTYDTWEIFYEPLVRSHQIELYFVVSSSGTVNLFWQRLSKSGDSCEEAKRGGCQEAGTKWYTIKAPDQDENTVIDNLVIHFENTDANYDYNDISNTISVSFKTNCNSPAFYDTTFTIDPYSEESVVFSADQLAVLGWPDLLFSCTSSTSCRIEHWFERHTLGESCLHPKDLAWEPVEQQADMERWYLFNTHDGTFNPIIPDTCDMRFVITNTSDETANVNADVYFDCREEERISQKSYMLEPYRSEYLDIDRGFLERFGWPSMIYNVTSDQNISIKAELIPDSIRPPLIPCGDTIWYNDNIYLDNGDSYYWWEADTVIYESGTYQHTFTTNLGCDSIVTLNVTIGCPFSGDCGDNLVWTFSCDSVLTISGTGPMWNYDVYADYRAPWDQFRYAIKSIIIEEGVTSIGKYAFYFCTKVTSATIPNTITRIEDESFINCSNLQSLTIPNGITHIGNDAFSSCHKINSVTIPSSVTSIYYRAFSNCKSLSSINVESDNPNYCSIDGVLFDKGVTTLGQYPAGKSDTSYIIPNSVTTIRDAFHGCEYLLSIKIPNSVTSISTNAFTKCCSLRSVTYSNSMTTIPSWIFRDCNSLVSFEIPNGITSIGVQSFWNDSSLTSVTIPSSVTNFGKGAFQNCISLTSVTNYATTAQIINSNVFDHVNLSACTLYVPAESIEAYQAADVWKEFGSIQAIGDSVEITYSTIADLYNMAQDSTFTLGAFDVVYVPDFQNGSNMYIKDETGSMVIYKVGYGLQAGDHVEAGLQGRINIYHGLYEVAPVSAKEDLTVTAGDAPAPMVATEVPSANNVNQFVVYKNVSFATDTAFVESKRHAVHGTWNNQQITFYNQYYIGAMLSANKTYNITAVNSVYGTNPQAYPLAVEEVTTDTLEPCLIASGTCGDNLTWELSCDSVLTISGTGEMRNYSFNYSEQIPGTPWNLYLSNIKSVIIEDGVTSIGSWAFDDCSNCTSFEIKNTVTSIGKRAFSSCISLRSLNIPESVMSIGEETFFYCPSLSFIEVDTNNMNFCSIEGVLFNKDCTTLICYPSSKQGAYTIPQSVSSIFNSAFNNCIGLPYIVIPNSVTDIGRDAFFYCTGLTSLTIGNGVTNIGKEAFYNCRSITSLTCYATIPPSCEYEVFGWVNKSIPLHVPAGSIAAYQAADVWKDFLNILPIGGPVEPTDSIYDVVYLDQADLQIDAEPVTLHLPVAPIIEGFTFLKWQVVAGDLEDGIYIQAVYTANDPTNAPEVYTNPANKAQKLIRNGQVYILTDDKVYSISGQKVK